jgi:outer membrane protein assembly factor BamE (lipoprotein component of BamABCDE complex)
MRYRIIAAFLAAIALQACAAASEHRTSVSDPASDRISAGKVQREIRTGMSSAEVIGVLGSPNLVSTDDQRRETWVYDKVATENAYSTSNGGVGLLLFGAGGGTGASSSNQRTLTVVIKFDQSSRVRDFSYRQSSF